jgi:hypothetical protein
LDISLEIASFVKTGRRLSGYSQGGERVEKGKVSEPTYKFAVYLWIFFPKTDYMRIYCNIDSWKELLCKF